ncbi:MAG: patatin-like phospholipase family protein [Ginsengibacter sp.]
MITNLAFKGGGVRGIAFVGALRELQKSGSLTAIQRVAGTSAGALVAAMYTLGYSIDKIYEIMQGINFKQFEDEFNPFRVATHYGIYGGTYILELAQNLLTGSGKELNANSTFADMKTAGCIDLYIFATNLNSHCVTEFSADKTPTTYVAEAVRASMSIPVFFKAWQFSNGIPDNDIYVDGGLMFNYPLSFFDNARFSATGGMANTETLGLFLRTDAANKCRHELAFDSFMHYARHLFESMLDVQDEDFDEDGDQVSRSVIIDDLGIPATDFNLTSNDMNNLVASGAKGATEYLKRVEQITDHS